MRRESPLMRRGKPDPRDGGFLGRSRWLWSSQIIRFLVIGAGNTFFGYSVYLFCLWIGVQYQMALVIATIVGVVFNFFTTGRIVFRNSALTKIVAFFLVYGVVLAANMLLLTYLVERGMPKPAGQAILLPVIVTISFLLNKYFVFGERA